MSRPMAKIVFNSLRKRARTRWKLAAEQDGLCPFYRLKVEYLDGGRWIPFQEIRSLGRRAARLFAASLGCKLVLPELAANEEPGSAAARALAIRRHKEERKRLVAKAVTA